MNRGSRLARKPLRLRSQLREVARAEILDATEALIAAHGLLGAPLTAIAQRAGVAVGTIYNYFTDREALIAALFEDRRSALRPKLQAAIDASKQIAAFEPRVRALVGGLLTVYDAHRLFIKVAIETEHIRLAPSAAAKDLHAALDELMLAGVAEQQVRREDAALAATMLAGAIKAVMLRRVSAGEPLAGDSDAVVALFLDGVRR